MLALGTWEDAPPSPMHLLTTPRGTAGRAPKTVRACGLDDRVFPVFHFQHRCALVCRAFSLFVLGGEGLRKYFVCVLCE